MEQIEKIYGSINKVMEDIGAVGKNRQNEKQKYMFRGIDDVMNALYPALIKNKVFAVPNVKNKQREERKSSGGNNIIYTIVEVEYSFFSAEDGSSIEFIVYGEGMDSGDKSMNKAMSAAFKYACFQLFCIPTEELKDSEIDSFEVKDRIITENEQKELKAACGRTGMNLEKYLAKYKMKLSEMPYTWYCKLMIKLANTDSVVPASTLDGNEFIDDDGDLPFK